MATLDKATQAKLENYKYTVNLVLQGVYDLGLAVGADVVAIHDLTPAALAQMNYLFGAFVGDPIELCTLVIGVIDAIYSVPANFSQAVFVSLLMHTSTLLKLYHVDSLLELERANPTLFEGFADRVLNAMVAASQSDYVHFRVKRELLVFIAEFSEWEF